MSWRIRTLVSTVRSGYWNTNWNRSTPTTTTNTAAFMGGCRSVIAVGSLMDNRSGRRNEDTGMIDSRGRIVEQALAALSLDESRAREEFKRRREALESKLVQVKEPS